MQPASSHCFCFTTWLSLWIPVGFPVQKVSYHFWMSGKSESRCEGAATRFLIWHTGWGPSPRELYGACARRAPKLPAQLWKILEHLTAEFKRCRSYEVFYKIKLWYGQVIIVVIAVFLSQCIPPNQSNVAQCQLWPLFVPPMARQKVRETPAPERALTYTFAL